MQVVSGAGVPLLPGVDILPQRAVTAARHVRQHAVKLHHLPAAVGRLYARGGQLRGVVVDDGEAGTLQALHLMHHQVATLVVAVVSNHEAL